MSSDKTWLAIQLPLLFLGDITPRYRDLLLGAFLKTTNDSDPLVRASTLSCLGDLCKELRYSLGPFVHQVTQFNS